MDSLLDFKEQMIWAGNILFQSGLANGSAGNLSLMVDDNTVLCTPTGSCLGNLKPDEISVVDMDNNLLSGNKPTKEVKFHLSFYKVNPKIRAIVHLHSPYSTAYSCLSNLDAQNALKPITPYVVMRLGKIKVTPYRKPGSDLIADDVLKIGSGTKGFLLANHGMVVGGKDIIDATYNAYELEDSCKLYFITNNYPVKFLNQEEIIALSE